MNHWRHQRRIQKIPRNDNKNTMTQNLWDAAKNSYKREVYSITILHQERRKISNNLNLYLKKLEKEEEQQKQNSNVKRRK